MRTVLLTLFTATAFTNIFTQDIKVFKVEVIKKITKALCLPLLLGFYISSSDYPSFNMILALVFGWLGDVILMIEKKDENNNYVVEDRIIISGMVFFLIGHLFYVLEFSSLIGGFNHLPYELNALLPLFILMIAFMVNVIKPKGLLKIGMICYGIVLSLMGFFTLLLLYTSASVGATLVFMGALIFISSDAVLSLRIIKRVKGIPNSYIMLSYLSAQLLIILGIIMIS